MQSDLPGRYLDRVSPRSAVAWERPNELHLHTFFVLTSFTKDEMRANETADFYPERAFLENHVSKHESVLNVNPSQHRSANKAHQQRGRANRGLRVHPVRFAPRKRSVHVDHDPNPQQPDQVQPLQSRAHEQPRLRPSDS